MRAAKASAGGTMRVFVKRQLLTAAYQAAVMWGACALWLLLGAMLPAQVLAVMYGIYCWALCPLLGGYLVVRAVLKGMQPYLALWALPLWPALAQLTVTGTALDMRFVLGYALVGVVCAAAGDELRKRREGSGKGSGKRPSK